jgi:hypothetical protein
MLTNIYWFTAIHRARCCRHGLLRRVSFSPLFFDFLLPSPFRKPRFTCCLIYVCSPQYWVRDCKATRIGGSSCCDQQQKERQSWQGTEEPPGWEDLSFGSCVPCWRRTTGWFFECFDDFLFYVLDVSGWKPGSLSLQRKNLIADTIKHHGRLDILVSNAAVNPVFGPTLNVYVVHHWSHSIRIEYACLLSLPSWFKGFQLVIDFYFRSLIFADIRRIVG